SKPAVPQANPRQTSPSPQARITSTTNRVATEDRLRRTQRRSGSSTNASGTPLAAIMTTLVVLVLLGGGYLGAAQQGMVPGFGLVGGGTPTPDLVAQQNATATAVAVIAAAATDTPTPTSTSTEVPPTATATATHTPTTVPPTATEEATPTPTISPTPSETPNVTQTVAAEQTATISACEFDYAIVDQVPDDGEPGGFFPVNEPYTREISLLNTGTCPWGENTSMTFVGGEDFDAGPRIFIRDSLAVGEEITVIFEGTTPDRGSLEPLVGTWQLRTRGQVSIGNPIDISILVFDPGA
ncbi:MAG: NBR1-Ig-like domain-containing protein, partial [Chloroflexota bacterium]